MQEALSDLVNEQPPPAQGVCDSTQSCAIARFLVAVGVNARGQVGAAAGLVIIGVCC